MKKNSLIVYFKPSCSKCRTFKQSMESEGISCEYIEYLAAPLDEAGLVDVIHKLGIKPFDLIRKSEELYKDKYQGKKRSDAQWIKILAKNPVLMQRPIVIDGNKAWIARDEETIANILAGQ